MENGVQNKPPLNLPQRGRLLELLLEALPELNALIGEQKEVITLRVFVDEYSNLIKQNRSAAYHKSVVNSLKHLTDYFGCQRAIQTIGLKDIEGFISHLQRKVKKPVSHSVSRGEGYRVYVRTLKAAFNKAVDWNYVKENYFMKVKLPKKQQVNPAYISSTQLAVISMQIENRTIQDLVTFAFYTGMRLNEIVNLTWRNVNLSTRIITVGDAEFTTKGRNQRYIPICEEVFEVLARSKGQEEKSNTPRILRIHPSQRGEIKSGFVFCKANGEAFTGDYVSKIFKKACKAVGTDKSIHFHSLRHSFASNLVQKGVNLYTIKELLGHSSISTTEVYAHLNLDALKEAIRTFDASSSLSTGSSTSFRVTSDVKKYGV
ncbi:MAG: tyrosine-type recombinase/integrase [Ignavibacteriales bacterium]|nr:site-specific integrase [Ignavibacterium sp.]MCZ2268097.1 tyrosine-type recombinase/integrase [Ignavibacteriales bacterium]